MKSAADQSDAGYSPPLDMELILHDERFEVSSLGPGQLSLRSARTSSPGRGIVRLVIDGRTTLFHVEMFEGIDPARQDQSFRTLEVVQEAVA
jgi:hypothetical protein